MIRRASVLRPLVSLFVTLLGINLAAAEVVQPLCQYRIFVDEFGNPRQPTAKEKAALPAEPVLVAPTVTTLADGSKMANFRKASRATTKSLVIPTVGATIQINVKDAAGEGFNDTTPVTPV